MAAGTPSNGINASAALMPPQHSKSNPDVDAVSLDVDKSPNLHEMYARLTLNQKAEKRNIASIFET